LINIIFTDPSVRTILHFMINQIFTSSAVRDTLVIMIIVALSFIQSFRQ
jgi:hypothetical protein